MSKIRLKIDIPVSPEEGMTEGRVLDVLSTVPAISPRTGEPKNNAKDVWVRGDTGKVKILHHEYELVEGEL